MSEHGADAINISGLLKAQKRLTAWMYFFARLVSLSINAARKMLVKSIPGFELRHLIYLTVNSKSLLVNLSAEKPFCIRAYIQIFKERKRLLN